MSTQGECIIFFVKYPEPGAVKTRLARVIGDELAARAQAAFIRDTLTEMDKTGLPVFIAYRPLNRREEIVEFCGKHREYVPQDEGDLGYRMYAALRQVFDRGFERAVLVGSDIPAMTSGVITDALANLHSFDAVLGPAGDGGYYLIGFRADTLIREAFSRMSWGTDEVFAQTVDTFTRNGMPHWDGPILQDIDTLEDYIEVMDTLKRQKRTDTETYEAGTMLGLDDPTLGKT